MIIILQSLECLSLDEVFIKEVCYGIFFFFVFYYAYTVLRNLVEGAGAWTTGQ
jgi:hypothetical protein